MTGSASSTSEDSTSEDDSDNSKEETTLSRLLAKQRFSSTNGATSHSKSDTDTEDMELVSPRSPLLWFEASTLIQDTQFGIYRTIFPSAINKTSQVAWLTELRNLQLVQDTSRLGKRNKMIEGQSTTTIEPTSRTWTLLAVGGGHFAGMIISLVPKLSLKNGRIERELTILKSKTFHRYTTRRKQGGSQSTNDAAKGNAKSAGAQIRRYNESMLTDEIRLLLSENWREEIDKSELIFLRASKTSQRIFYDYDQAVLSKSGLP